MLNNISWQGYWTTLALLTAAYYFLVYWRYFRKDLLSALSKRNPVSSTPAVSPAVASFLHEQAHSPLTTREVPEDDFCLPTDPVEQTVYSCMDELNAYFESAKKAKMMKAEVLFALERILQKYPSLTGSAYTESIGNVIRTEAEHHCAVHLSEEDISKVWKRT